MDRGNNKKGIPINQKMEIAMMNKKKKATVQTGSRCNEPGFLGLWLWTSNKQLPTRNNKGKQREEERGDAKRPLEAADLLCSREGIKPARD